MRWAHWAQAAVVVALVTAAIIVGAVFGPETALAQTVSPSPAVPSAGKVYKVTPYNASTCVAAAVSGSRDDLSAIGANVQLSSFSGRRAQLIRVSAASGGGYKLQPVNAMDYDGCLTAEGFGRSQNVSVESWGSEPTQRWTFVSNGDGTITVAAASKSGYALDLNTSGTAAGTNVQLHTSNGSGAQKFLFYEVTSGAMNAAMDSNAGNSGLYIDTSASSGPSFASIPSGPKYVPNGSASPLGKKTGWFVGVGNGASATATYSNVGTFNGEPVSVQVRVYSCTKPTADLDWGSVIDWAKLNFGGRTSLLVFPERFSGEFAMFNLACVNYEFKFYKTNGGSPSAPITVGTSYFSATDLDQMGNAQEWAASVTPASGAYVQSNNYIMSGPLSWNGGSVADAFYAIKAWLGSEDYGEGTVTFKYTQQSSITVRVGTTGYEMGFNMVFKAPYAVPAPATVNYYADGSLAWSTTVAANTTVGSASDIMATAEAKAKKGGCSFSGWFEDSACTRSFQSRTLASGATLDLYGYSYAAVVYHSDGTEVHTENARFGSTVVPSRIAEAKATKPDCSGFYGWYTDPACTKPYTAAKLSSGVDLYGRNAVVVSYGLTDAAAGLFFGQAVCSDRELTVPADPISDLPDAYRGWYGDSVVFGSPAVSPVYIRDGTVRTVVPSDGVYAVRAPGRGDALMKSAKITRTGTVYVDWEASIYDGFETSR